MKPDPLNKDTQRHISPAGGANFLLAFLIHPYKNVHTCTPYKGVPSYLARKMTRDDKI